MKDITQTHSNFNFNNQSIVSAPPRKGSRNCHKVIDKPVHCLLINITIAILFIMCSTFNYFETLIWTMAAIIFIMGLTAHYFQETRSEFVMLKVFGGLGHGYKSIQSNVSILEVPKRWFAHFYIFGVTFQSIIFYTLVNLYLLKNDTNTGLFSVTKCVLEWIEAFHAFVGIKRQNSQNTQELVNIPTILLTSFLFLIHLIRRLYETLFVFIYSDTSKMSLVVYLTSFLYYFSAITSLISTTPNMNTINWSSSLPDLENADNFCNKLLTFWHLVGLLIFIYGSIGQHKAHIILRDLRKGQGKQTVSKHFIPHGSLYELISCPNYWCEILIYIGFGFLFKFQNFTWNAIIGLVISNQIIAGLTSHQWYLKSFPNYPKTRKAIIPYLW